MRIVAVFSCLILVACGGAEQAAPAATADRESVFDPLTETLDRAESVQETVDAQTEELRRRVEEAER